MNAIKLIAMDVDGTLFDSNSRIPDANKDAILRAQRAGILVVIASGRVPLEMLDILETYNLHCPVIGNNGGNAVDERGKQLFSHYMRPESAREALERLIAINDGDFFMGGEDFICYTQTDRARKVLENDDRGQYQRTLPRREGIEKMYAALNEPIYKFFLWNCSDVAAAREKLSGIPDVSLTCSGRNNVEIMPAGVDKGAAVRQLAAMHGIGMESVMTLGDQENDIPMLRAARYGVAMGNATPETKQSAAFITETNDRFGVAKAIEEYALSGDHLKNVVIM